MGIVRWSRFRDLLADPDVRSYLRHAAFRRSLWRLDRPDLTSRRPEYLAQAASVRPVLTAGPGLLWGQHPSAPATADLHLAAMKLKGARFEALPWNRHFADAEDESALHRFAWLLPWMFERYCEGTSSSAVWDCFSTAASDWIKMHPSPAEVEAWQAYTVSERIVNWVLAVIALGRFPFDGEMVASLVRQAEHLNENLEYFGERYTGNHLSNNGRALYFAGSATGRADLASVGRAILLEERVRLFSDTGFLREGSAHYQFLVTRNYAEAMWLAGISGDTALVSELKATVDKLRDACAFFLVPDGKGWRIPLIGDISPDCLPEWLLGVATSHRLGWAAMVPASRGDGLRAAGDRDWGRIDVDGWTVFAHVNGNGTPLVPGHAHHDTGGIVVFHRGDPVVLDCGRKHYICDPVGRHGVSGASHSLLVVDGLNPEPADSWLLSREFLRQRSGAPPELTVSDNRMLIAHHGYERSSSVGICRREVAAKGDTLTVTDAIEGWGDHRLTLLFHLPGGTLRDGKIGFSTGHGRMLLHLPSGMGNAHVITASAEGTLGWAADRYGDLVPISSVIAEARVRLPWHGITIIHASS